MFFKKKQKKAFEDRFMDLQSDMVSICLEYCENCADMIYIYASCEEGVMSTNVFYRINGMCLHKHKLNDAPGEHPVYTTSADNQRTVSRIMMDDLQKIRELCDEEGKPLPAEMRLYYDVKKNSLDARYKYDPVWSNDPDKSWNDVFLEWFEEESGR